jgi:hypothetical protein
MLSLLSFLRDCAGLQVYSQRIHGNAGVGGFFPVIENKVANAARLIPRLPEKNQLYNFT